MATETHQIAHVILTIVIGLFSGGFGAGITIATFRNDIKSLKQSVKEIMHNQDILRGNGGNAPPLFIRRAECDQLRIECNARVCLATHGKAIESLTNFARYSMTKDGLTQQEINDILKIN